MKKFVRSFVGDADANFCVRARSWRRAGPLARGGMAAGVEAALRWCRRPRRSRSLVSPSEVGWKRGLERDASQNASQCVTKCVTAPLFCCRSGRIFNFQWKWLQSSVLTNWMTPQTRPVSSLHLVQQDEALKSLFYILNSALLRWVLSKGFLENRFA